VLLDKIEPGQNYLDWAKDTDQDFHKVLGLKSIKTPDGR
jgi:hypothetical protein